MGRPLPGKPKRLALDAHVAAPHGVAANPAVVRGERAWQESRKLPREVVFVAAWAAERHSMPSATSTTHSLHLPFFEAGGGHTNADALGAVE